ncbi:MAG: GIY-YIG nuclease family protein [Candidatus Doudnabacteria bacterium]|nr:GIY-YIG nuclease family protein [Candidatus Doudnabacteria bacterium]
MYYVYIIQSQKDRSYYTGYTTDVEKQLQKHNEGGQKFTSQKRPYALVWYCAFVDKQKANAFERYLKQGSGFAFARKHLV